MSANHAPDYAAAQPSPCWWEREDLHFAHGQLLFGGESVAALTSWSDRPVFVYNAGRSLDNVTRLSSALAGAFLTHELFFAIKANRFSPLLTILAQSGKCGADVCSPKEVMAALGSGFPAERISFTASALSDADLDFLTRHPKITINLDSLSALRRFGEQAPGRPIGLRLNPEQGVGGNDKLVYSGHKPTKFGLYPEQWGEALGLVELYGMRIDGLHVHMGCGYLNEHLPAWQSGIERALSLRSSLPDVRRFNVGGGLGVPHSASWGSLYLDQWSRSLRQCFAGSGLLIQVEPGEYIAKDAGLLVATVSEVEVKGGTRFVTINAGFNLAPEPAFYGLPCEPVPCRPRTGLPERVTIAGNINEALDIWCEDIFLPPLREGDRIAFLNAGAYAASMSSNHCLRGSFSELLLPLSGAKAE